MNREQIEQEVLRLADTWAAAELHGDTTFLEDRLSDDFIGIGPLGFMLTRQEWLARHPFGINGRHVVAERTPSGPDTNPIQPVTLHIGKILLPEVLRCPQSAIVTDAK